METRKSGGRPTTLKGWEPHRETCHRLYFDEKKSINKVIAYMQEHHGLTATKRTLWYQFRKWDFPTKKSTATPIDEKAMARIKELWLQNVGHREMFRILNEEEGWNINKRTLFQLRKKNKMMFRAKEGDRIYVDGANDHDDDDGDGGSGFSGSDSGSESDASSVVDTGEGAPPPQRETRTSSRRQAPAKAKAKAKPAALAPAAPLALMDSPVPAPEIFPTPVKTAPQSRGHNKPRRLTRDFGCKPRDVAVPPRFPSELTLDEAKGILGLDEASYKGMRSIFTELCEEAGVVKKTIAGPERWEALKDDLIRRFPPLEAEMWQSRDNLEGKKLALDVICSDCTKRMRIKMQRVSLPDARTVLGLDPLEVRQIRVLFYNLVEKRGIHSKTTAGLQEWTDVKNEWVAQSPIIQRILGGGPADPAHEEKLKALERFARDVVKRRWQEDGPGKREKKKPSASTSKSPVTPSAQAQGTQGAQGGPSTGQANSQTNSETPETTSTEPRYQLVNNSPMPTSNTQYHHSLAGHGGILHPAFQQMPSAPSQPQTHASSSLSLGPQQQQQQIALDPQLGFVGQPPAHLQAHEQAQAQAQVAAPGPPSTSVAIFLRLHPSSTYSPGANVWIGTMAARSVRELRQAAIERHPEAACLRVEGILKDGKGGEMPLLIDGDAELEAYLVHLNGATPTFSVQLVPGWRS